MILLLRYLFLSLCALTFSISLTLSPSLSHSLYLSQSLSLQLPLSPSPFLSLTCIRTFTITHCFSLCNSRLCYLIFYFPVSLTRFLIRLSFFHFLNHHLSLSQSPNLHLSISFSPSLNLLFSQSNLIFSLSKSYFLTGEYDLFCQRAHSIVL